jgi:hypothetical protein
VDTDWMPQAYDAANEGDWTQFSEHIAPHYVHHIEGTGLQWTGREEAIAGLRALYAEIGLRQNVQSVSAHGDFVIANVAFTSDLHPESADAVHVFRVEDDRFVELTAAYPPRPAA